MLRGLAPRWIALDVGVPLAVSAVVGALARALSLAGETDVYTRLACGAAWALLAFTLAFATSPGLRAAAMQRFRGATFRAL
jgi:hypothetical protein